MFLKLSDFDRSLCKCRIKYKTLPIDLKEARRARGLRATLRRKLQAARGLAKSLRRAPRSDSTAYSTARDLSENESARGSALDGNAFDYVFLTFSLISG